MTPQAALRARDRDPELQALLDGMIGGGLVTAIVALAGSPAGVDRHAAAGVTRRVGGRTVRPVDRFDLASLTKPFTAALALVLDRRGLLPLEVRVGDIWPGRAAPRLADRRLESLLRHRSGLGAWTPLYRRSRTVEGAIRYLLSAAALSTRRERYSDLDYILWGLSAERALGQPYESLLRRYLVKPLGLRRVGSSPGGLASVVECRMGNRREVALAAEQGIAVGARPGPDVGTVQDGNARFLGGLAGHAGLFASASELWCLATEWLAPRRVLPADAVASALAGGRRFNLGWVRATVRGSAGPTLGAGSFGHLGFTGGSLWIDGRRDAIMLMLAHRTSERVDLKPWRRRFHRMVLGQD